VNTAKFKPGIQWRFRATWVLLGLAPALTCAATDGIDLSSEVRSAYQHGDWDRFFGLALYYRLAAHDGTFDPAPSLLEITALMRHCRVIEASQLADELQSRVPAQPATERERRFANDLIRLRDLIHLRVKRAATRELSPRDEAWRLTENQLRASVAKFSDPRILRVRVKSLCRD
jgi:hypothetical protein